MIKAPEKRLTFNKDGVDFMLWDLHAKTGAKRSFIIPHDQITSIQFDKCTHRKLFKKIEGESITLTTRIQYDPFMIYSDEEPKYFAEYKEAIRAFAKKNMITLRDETV